jgi:outer membrane protein OmpA-like peptidoglycan-associated protein
VKSLARIVLGALLCSGLALAAEPDAEGCADHPLLTRISGYRIDRCRTVEFDAMAFSDAKGNETNVEGKLTEIHYTLHEGQADKGRIQIVRNYENAFKKLGGGLVYVVDGALAYYAAVKGDKAVWAVVNAYNTQFVGLSIVEKEAMRQDVVADAASFASGLKDTGHVAVYGIYFDTGKSDVKPESDAALKEIAKLLSEEAKLRIYVVGHTDSVGQLDANMKLSQARAEAVAKTLAAKHGIAASRLKAMGAGPISPVASNATEEGKAKNRRVELVEQ